MCERLVGKLFFSTLFTVFLFYFEGPIKIQVKLSHIVKENPETTHTIYEHRTSQQVVIPTRHMLLPHKGSRSRYFGYVQTPDWVQEKITNEGKHDVWLKFRTLRSSGWQRRVTLPSNPAPCPSCLSVCLSAGLKMAAIPSSLSRDLLLESRPPHSESLL